MVFRFEYASRRSEVWRWYWKLWKRGLWKFHLGVLVLTAGTVFVWGAGPEHPVQSILTAIGLGTFLVVLMIAYPQIMFKPQNRVLLVCPDGIETAIGKISAKRAWKDMRSVSEDGDSIVLSGKNGNAFIVPRRAFASAEARTDFLAFSRKCISAVAV